MTTLHSAALDVSLDEPAGWLSETEQPVYIPGRGAVQRRILRIAVSRNGRQAIYMEDLGDASTFRGGEFMIPGGLPDATGYIRSVETVGALLDIANAARDERPLRERRGLELGDLRKAFIEQGEEQYQQARRVSTFGPFSRRQRDG